MKQVELKFNYVVNGAIRNDGKITVNEIAKIHELDNN